jgi:prepilin-type N-terminal cleavage/methylation domain-containing protein
MGNAYAISKRRLGRAGFTLLELSVVLVIASLLISGLLSITMQDARRAKQAALKAKMDTIETAIVNFAKTNNRLPCPADGFAYLTHANFGLEALAAGSCVGSASYDANGVRAAATAPGTLAADFYNQSVSTYTVGGAVPVRTLGLADSFMFDPWGNRFSYFVDKRMTASVPAAFITYLASDATIGSMTVMDGSGYPAKTNGNAITTKAVLVIISHGPNGFGAFQAGVAGSSALRKPSSSTNADEQQNCHCTSAGATVTATAFDSTFVQHAATNSSASYSNVFDDTVRFYLRSNLLTATDLLR